MSMLDGVVPYGMGPGNHDQPTTLFNQFFPYTRYQGQPWYGGHYQNLNDNNYQLFSGGGMDFVIVHLEYCPPAAALSWASSVLQSYPDRIGMMTTHAYLGLGAVRSTHGCGSTQYIWDQLAVPSPNLQFMLSGHVHGESRRADVVNGHPVYQMLADYQNLPSGGEGWLRILRFVPADNKVYVQTYSPWLNRFDTDADSEFTLDFPMGGAFAAAGSTTAPSASEASIPLAGLAPNTQYEWRATVTNSSGKSRTGPVWSFTTGAGAPINQPPIALGQSVNVLEDTATPITLTAFDQNDDQVTFTVVNGPSHGTLSGVEPTLTYRPAANFNGTDSFTVQANDGQATSAPGTIAITVQPVNDTPVAAGESYTVQAGQTLTVAAPGVLGNDTDADGTALVAQLLMTTIRGALTLNANGSLTYTPAAGYSGSDSFLYRVSDGQIASATAIGSITILPGDTTAPAVTMTAPAAGATVSGTVTVSANASDNTGVAGVQFLLDGAPLGAEDTAAPYSVTWTSTGVADGATSTVRAGARRGRQPGDRRRRDGHRAEHDSRYDRAGRDHDGPGRGRDRLGQCDRQRERVGQRRRGGRAVPARRGAAGRRRHGRALQRDVDLDRRGRRRTSSVRAGARRGRQPGDRHRRDRQRSQHRASAAASGWRAGGLIQLQRRLRNHADRSVRQGPHGDDFRSDVDHAGKYGSALTFDGVNDWVTVADAADLDLTTGMTLEAWVRPSSLGSWRTVVLKQSPAALPTRSTPATTSRWSKATSASAPTSARRRRRRSPSTRGRTWPSATTARRCGCS